MKQSTGSRFQHSMRERDITRHEKIETSDISIPELERIQNSTPYVLPVGVNVEMKRLDVTFPRANVSHIILE